jgi:hypothetical protein
LPTYPKAQPQLYLNEKHKKSHLKKNLMLSVIDQNKQALEDNLKLSQWEEEEEERRSRSTWMKAHVHLARENLIWSRQMTKLLKAF